MLEFLRKLAMRTVKESRQHAPWILSDTWTLVDQQTELRRLHAIAGDLGVINNQIHCLLKKDQKA